METTMFGKIKNQINEKFEAVRIACELANEPFHLSKIIEILSTEEKVVRFVGWLNHYLDSGKDLKYFLNTEFEALSNTVLEFLGDYAANNDIVYSMMQFILDVQEMLERHETIVKAKYESLEEELQAYQIAESELIFTIRSRYSSLRRDFMEELEKILKNLKY